MSLPLQGMYSLPQRSTSQQGMYSLGLHVLLSCDACDLAAGYRVSGMHAARWASGQRSGDSETSCAPGRPTTPSRSRRGTIQAVIWAICTAISNHHVDRQAQRCSG